MATSTQTEHQVRNVTEGRYLEETLAAAITITTGFRPRYVKVVNVTSGDMMEWFEGMTDASAIRTVAAGTRSILATLGITDNANGFIIGLDL